MLKACFLVKYPPIQGGVSMTSYWLACDLAERGHQVFVVTNANEVEDEYRIYMDDSDREWYEPRSSNGGFVRVYHTQSSSVAFSHIPQANPFVAKLSARATDVVRENDCDVIFSYYLQPFGLAAHLVSHWTGRPYMFRHAGSDLGRLMKQPGLTTAYREVIRAADCVWTSRSMRNTFLGLGVPEDKIWFGARPQLPGVFGPHAAPLDLNALLARLREVEASHVRTVLTNLDPIDTSKPTIGIYGKVGEVKGSFDLLKALALLKHTGRDFNLVALTQGRALPSFQHAIRDLDLQDRTWTLPFVPHWKVPGFLRACTAVCFLEREFPIAFHTPTVPLEVMACGTCLVLSGEIAAKQAASGRRLEDGRNVVLVANPRDHAELARQLRIVIDDPDRARRIGLAGFDAQAARSPGAGTESTRTLAAALEQQLERMRDARRHSAAQRQDDDRTRKQRLKAQLPWASALLGDEWDRLVEKYCGTDISQTGNQFDDAVRLCEFLRAYAPELNGGRRQFEDVLRYERSHNALYGDHDAAPEPDRAPATLPRNALVAAALPRRLGGRPYLLDVIERGVEEVLKVRPIQAAGVSVETFDSDFGALASAVRRGADLHALPPAKTIVVFKKEFNRVGVELKINDATGALLALCDGRHTVQSAIDAMACIHEPHAGPGPRREQLTHEVIEAIRELSGKDLVRFVIEG